jgi:hypothetical protein
MISLNSVVLAAGARLCLGCAVIASVNWTSIPRSLAAESTKEIGLPSPADLDGDGIPNNDDPEPEISNFPLVVLTFSEPHIGIRYSVSGTVSSTETRSDTDTRKTTVTDTRTTRLASSSSMKSSFASKLSSSLTLGKGISFVPSFEAGSNNENEQRFENVNTIEEQQLVSRERALFLQTVKQQNVSFASNGGFVTSSLQVTNHSDIDAKLTNIRLSVTYLNFGRRVPFLSNIKLLESPLVASPGPSSDTSAPAPTTSQPAIVLKVGKARTGLATRTETAAVFGNLDVTATQDLASKLNVAVVVEDYDVEIGGRKYTRQEYEAIIADLAEHLVTVEEWGPSGEIKRLMSAYDVAATQSTVRSLLSHFDKKISFEMRDDAYFAASYDGVASDLSWKTRDELLKADNKSGRWALFVNGQLLGEDPAKRKMEAGDTLSVVFVSNLELKRRLFERSETHFDLVLTENAFEVLGPTADRTIQAGRSPAMRGCTNLQVKAGDVLNFKVRTAQSPDRTINTEVHEYYDLGGGNTRKLWMLCQARRFVPETDQVALSRDDLLSTSQPFLAFGNLGPAIPLAKLGAELPPAKVRLYDDGTLAFELLITPEMVSTPSNLCIGLPDLRGHGQVGRAVTQPSCSGGGNAFNQALCGSAIQVCDQWRNADPARAEREFARTMKSSIDLTIFSSLAPSTSK